MNRKFLEHVLEESIHVVVGLGEEGKRNISSEAGKRTCLAEKEVHDCVLERMREELGTDFHYICEGFTPIGNPEAKTKVLVDPLDGTLFYVRQQSKHTFPIGISLSVLEGDKYGGVIGAAIGDLQSGEVWSTRVGGGTFSNFLSQRTANPVYEGEPHQPVVQTDFYFPQNTQARLKLKHLLNPKWVNFEAQNCGSTILQLAKVAIGEADVHYQVEGTGPTPWEIAPAYLLIKNAGGVVYSLRDLANPVEFGQVPFDLAQKREPVLAARNEEIAQRFFEMLKY